MIKKYFTKIWEKTLKYWYITSVYIIIWYAVIVSLLGNIYLWMITDMASYLITLVVTFLFLFLHYFIRSNLQVRASAFAKTAKQHFTGNLSYFFIANTLSFYVLFFTSTYYRDVFRNLIANTEYYLGYFIGSQTVVLLPFMIIGSIVVLFIYKANTTVGTGKWIYATLAVLLVFTGTHLFLFLDELLQPVIVLTDEMLNQIIAYIGLFLLGSIPLLLTQLLFFGVNLSSPHNSPSPSDAI
jgi:hypothetical protein